jgi:hypothetical protein
MAVPLLHSATCAAKKLPLRIGTSLYTTVDPRKMYLTNRAQEFLHFTSANLTAVAKRYASMAS